VKIGTWLRSLGLGDSTALAARLDAGDLRLGVAGRLVGIYDAIGASAAQHGSPGARPFWQTHTNRLTGRSHLRISYNK